MAVRVGVVMGSDSDWPVMEGAAQALADVEPELVWLSLDSENAYCTVHRAASLDAVAEHLPALRAYAAAVLARRSQYLFWDAKGHTHRRYALPVEGVEQGDPLSPLLTRTRTRAL